MEHHETGKILSKILGKRELEKIPPDIATKVEKYFDQRFEEFLTTKALHSAAQRNIGKINIYKIESCVKPALFGSFTDFVNVCVKHILCFTFVGHV